MFASPPPERKIQFLRLVSRTESKRYNFFAYMKTVGFQKLLNNATYFYSSTRLRLKFDGTSDGNRVL